MNLHHRLLGLIWVMGSIVCTMAPQAANAQASREWGLRAIQAVTGLSQPASTLTSEHVAVNFGGSKPATTTSSSGQRQQVADARPMAVSAREYGVGTMTKAEIIQAAKAIMSPAKANQIAGIIKGVMAQGKVGSGVFIYEQQVRPKGVPRDMKLSWGVTVTENGYVFAGDPKVIDSDPTLVYMLYTSLAAEAGLPSSWTYADAGVLKWQLRKLDGTPATAWTTVNTGGAFDETADSEFKINCLSNKTTAGCPAGFVDAKTLMTETASAAAIIDYVRKVAPAYNEAIDPNTGETIFQPQMVVSYDQRILKRTSCSAGAYQNTGRIGYSLKTIIDRYQVVETDTAANRINRFESNSLSPTQNFDVTLNVANGYTNLSNKLLNPYTQELMAINEVPGVQYISPLQTINSNDQAIAITSGSANVTITQPSAGKYTIEMRGNATGSWAAAATSIGLQLNPLDFKDFILESLTFDWYGAVKTNGTELWYGPSYAYVHDGPIYCSSNNLWWGGCWASYYGGERMNQQLTSSINILPHLRNGNNIIDLMSIRNGITRVKITATSCMAN